MLARHHSQQQHSLRQNMPPSSGRKSVGGLGRVGGAKTATMKTVDEADEEGEVDSDVEESRMDAVEDDGDIPIEELVAIPRNPTTISSLTRQSCVSSRTRQRALIARVSEAFD